ncbi:retrovirus-related pol polyprotein from transposon TNT 1-94 [Tanacetum coccineum]
MVDDLRYFNSLEHEVDSLKSQLETQKTQFLNEIDRLSRKYYYADHMNAILGAYTQLDEVTNLQCDYMEVVEKCQRLKKELSKEQIKNDKAFKENWSNEFWNKREQYFEIQDLKAQLQDKGIAISELIKLIEELKGKSLETKFEKSSIIRQLNAFKRQRQSILGKPATFSDSLTKKDFSKPVTVQILPQNVKSGFKNTNVIAPKMYKLDNRITQTKTTQLPPDLKKTNKRVTFSTRVIATTSVSRPQLKSNPLEHRVLPNNSEVKTKAVEEHHRNFKFSKHKLFVTACNDSLNVKTSNLIEIILFIVDSRCAKHMTGNLKLLSNFVEKFLGTSSLEMIRLHRFLDMEIWFKEKLLSNEFTTYTWTHFLRSKDETPEVLIDFLRLVQRGLHAQVIIVRTDKGIGFLYKTLHEYFAQEGIEHQTLTARTPEQNGIVERRNCTLIEAARTMLSAANVPLLFWAEAIATACCTQNHSLVIPRHEKTPYHIINGQKLSVKFFHIFGSLCYIVRDGQNLDKMKTKGDACIFVGYSTQSRAYRVFNKRTRVLVETIHVNFDELPHMTSDHNSSGLPPQCQTMVLDQIISDPVSKCLTMIIEIVTTSNDLDLLFSLMFDELFNGSSPFVSKSSAVPAADVRDNHQQQDTTPSTSTTVAVDSLPLNIPTTPAPASQAPIHIPLVTPIENINQAESQDENIHIEEDEFVNIFNHPLEQFIRNPSQSVRTRRHLETDGEMCMFALTVSRTKLKNINEAMDNSTWIEVMQEELRQFDRLDVWGNSRKHYQKYINLKWLWKNKRDEEHTMIRNNAHVVAKGYS